MKCIRCGEELQSAGAAGKGLEGINGYCPNCQIYFKDDEPIAIQLKDKIVKL